MGWLKCDDSTHDESICTVLIGRPRQGPGTVTYTKRVQADWKRDDPTMSKLIICREEAGSVSQGIKGL